MRRGAAALCCAIAVAAAGLLPGTPAQAQSQTWGGTGSTTATAGYKVGTNWSHPPAGAPTAAGKSAIFDTTGSSTITVGAGAITPDSWTFNANSQSYTITGAAVNFSATGGLFNNANAGQTISIGGSFSPVVLMVTDTASHPVAGAVVEIYQTVDAWQPACPDRGRCPIAPVLASSQSSATSDANGSLTVLPEQLAGVAGSTNLAAVVGTQGFVGLCFEAQP